MRSCVLGDLSQILDIYAGYVLTGTSSFEIDPPSLAEMVQRFEKIVSGGYPYLVLEERGKILGYAYASAYRPRIAYRQTVENSIYLHSDSIGQGLGKRLLGSLIEECQSRGFRKMIAVIGDSANGASIGLHRLAGFEMVGVLTSVGYKHGVWLDTVLMQRTLGLPA